MLICRNAEGLHGQKKVGSLWSGPLVLNLGDWKIRKGGKYGRDIVLTCSIMANKMFFTFWGLDYEVMWGAIINE